MNDTTRSRREELDSSFGIREWITVLLTLGGLAVGASAVFVLAYWMLTGR